MANAENSLATHAADMLATAHKAFLLAAATKGALPDNLPETAEAVAILAAALIQSTAQRTSGPGRA